MTLTPARLLIPALLVAALALTGCSGTDNDDSGGSGGSGGSDSSLAGDAPAAATQERDMVDGFAATSDSELADLNTAARPAKATSAQNEPIGQEQALIRKGNVALRDHDVSRAQIEVQKVVDRYAGQVTEEKTQSDDDGKQTYTRMVLRIPSDDFNAAIDALKEIGELESANTNQDDVTTQVIDVQTRLAVQKRSIARISVLFDRAESIRDIMAIESELSQRQADLEALEKQSAYLANQTSLSTIVVSIDQIPEKTKAAPEKDDDAGFISGLKAGWGALATAAVGVATAAGALLPWLVVIAIIGVPTLLLVRSLRRRSRPAPAQPAAD